ncbi:hypothetical protein WJX77_006244 [Trebouxia sp. C0004]
MLQHALNRDPTVKFMVDKMKEAGCEVHKSFFQVENCDAQAGGGFRPPDGSSQCGLAQLRAPCLQRDSSSQSQRRL